MGDCCIMSLYMVLWAGGLITRNKDVYVYSNDQLYQIIRRQLLILVQVNALASLFLPELTVDLEVWHWPVSNNTSCMLNTVSSTLILVPSYLEIHWCQFTLNTWQLWIVLFPLDFEVWPWSVVLYVKHCLVNINISYVEDLAIMKGFIFTCFLTLSFKCDFDLQLSSSALQTIHCPIKVNNNTKWFENT